MGREIREIAEAEWGGPVCVPDSCRTGTDAYFPDDGYFAAVGDLRQFCEDEEIDLPAFVHGCSVRKLSLDACWIIERETEDDHHESVCEEALAAAPALQALLDEWCASLRCATWEEDGSVRVVLAPAAGGAS